MREGYGFRIDPGSTLRVLLVCVAVLVVLSAIGQALRFVGGFESALAFIPEFYLDEESNVPTYFSTLILLAAALLLTVIARVEYVERTRDRAHWAGLAVIFYYVALDEAASLHERLIGRVRDLLDLSGPFYFGWVVPGILVVAILTVVFYGFVLRRDPVIRRLFVLAAVLFVGGALGLEMLGGAIVDARGYDNPAFAVTAMLEETFEMIGTSVFVYALIRYAEDNVGVFSVQFQTVSAAEPIAGELRAEVEGDVELRRRVRDSADGHEIDPRLRDGSDRSEGDPSRRLGINLPT